MPTVKRATPTKSSKTKGTNSDAVTKAVVSPAPGNGNLLEAIRLRAYLIYEQRGCQGGSAVEDWLRAEAEIVSQHRSA